MPVMERLLNPVRHPVNPEIGCWFWAKSPSPIGNSRYIISPTYVVCERLSVMHQQAKLPEIFDQIPQNTPVLGFGSRTPPPNEILPRV